MSQVSSPPNYMLSSHGRSQATNQLTSSKGSITQEDERRTTETESAEEESSKQQQQQAASAKPDPEEDDHHQEHEKDAMRNHLTNGYEDLLNSSIEDMGKLEALPPSKIGASFWTSAEKEAFFRTLPSTGPHNLRALSDAIATKSEAEIRSYVLLLQVYSSPEDPCLSSLEKLTSAEVPAALEIGGDCENALELAAEAFEGYVLRQEVAVEKRRFGESWLIDGKLAAEIENRRQQLQAISSFKNEQTDEGDDEETEHENNGSDESEIDAQNGYATIKTASSANSSKSPDTFPHIASADLLTPSAFLVLSRSLFMNSATNMESNWSTIGASDSVSSTPAMFRSALDEFHNVAINVTSRLVNASLFQATSRLRAKDDHHPVAVVLKGDVEAAHQLLALVDRKPYWSSVARRCGVNVYSEAQKFRDGRQTTKTGVQLTYDEVEAELWVFDADQSQCREAEGQSDLQGSTRNHKGHHTNGIGFGNAMEDTFGESEALVDTSDSESLRGNGRERLGKRKRKFSFSSDEHDEDMHLEMIDKQASRAEEQRLLELLNHRASPLAQAN